jgi:DNA-binding response OmpR family regulator
MPTVLVVDDEPEILRVVELALQFEGYDVVTAKDGESGLAAVGAHHPDVVLLDVMLPGIDGWTVLERLKHGPEEHAGVPVVMLTARDLPEDRIRGGIEGAVRYLTKPFDPARLREEIRGALEDGPEPDQRRRVRQAALEELARLERGDGAPAAVASVRPHLTRLEHAHGAPESSAPAARQMRAAVAELSVKQLELLRALRDAPSVSEGAARLGVTRSNVYASLRRIGRKLGTRSVPELLQVVRSGELALDAPAG